MKIRILPHYGRREEGGAKVSISFKFDDSVSLFMWRKDQDQIEQLGLICGSQFITQTITENFGTWNIIFFETTGTFLFTYILVLTGGFDDFYSFIVSCLTLFACYLWTGRYGPALLNPCLTLLHMTKKQRRISLRKGFIYLSCQLIGTVVGTVLGFYVADYVSPSINLLQDKIYSTSMGALFIESIVTTFIFGVVVLTLISTDVTFVELELQVWFAIPILYAVVAILTDVTIGPNPFFGLIIPLFGCYYSSNWDLMTNVWPLIVAPIFGSFAAVLFFDFFYRKLVFVYKRQLREEQERAKRIQKEEALKKKNEAIAAAS